MKMNDISDEDRLVNVHKENRELEIFFAISILQRRFGIDSREGAKMAAGNYYK